MVIKAGIHTWFLFPKAQRSHCIRNGRVKKHNVSGKERNLCWCLPRSEQDTEKKKLFFLKIFSLPSESEKKTFAASVASVFFFLTKTLHLVFLSVFFSVFAITSAAACTFSRLYRTAAALRIILPTRNRKWANRRKKIVPLSSFICVLRTRAQEVPFPLLPFMDINFLSRGRSHSS